MAAERWRKRLNIQGEDVARAFDEGFAKLDEVAQGATPPQKDGSRCVHCRKKIELDTHHRAMCNGYCTDVGKGGKSCRIKGSISKIIALWKSLVDDDARAAALAAASVPDADAPAASASGIVGLSSSSSTSARAEAEDAAPRVPRCLRVCDSGDRCPGDALPNSSYCSRRCDAAEAARVARLCRLVLDERASEAASAAAPEPRRSQAPKAPKASLGSLLAGLEKPAKKAPPPKPAGPPSKPPSPPQVPRERAPPPPAASDEAELEAFVVQSIGQKYWSTFVEEEIDDLATLRLLTVKDFADMQIPLGPRLKLIAALQAA